MLKYSEASISYVKKVFKIQFSLIRRALLQKCTEKIVIKSSLMSKARSKDSGEVLPETIRGRNLERKQTRKGNFILVTPVPL